MENYKCQLQIRHVWQIPKQLNNRSVRFNFHACVSVTNTGFRLNPFSLKAWTLNLYTSPHTYFTHGY